MRCKYPSIGIIWDMEREVHDTRALAVSSTRPKPWLLVILPSYHSCASFLPPLPPYCTAFRSSSSSFSFHNILRYPLTYHLLHVCVITLVVYSMFLSIHVVHPFRSFVLCMQMHTVSYNSHNITQPLVGTI